MFGTLHSGRGGRITRQSSADLPFAREIRDLEQQHHDIFAQIQAYGINVKARRSPIMVRQLLDKIIRAIDSHFLTEETVLTRSLAVSRHELDWHRAEHRRIATELAAFNIPPDHCDRRHWLEMEHLLDEFIVHHLCHDSVGVDGCRL
jgi:hemerythrin